MKTKNKKLLAIGTGVMAVALGVGVFASLGHDGLLLRSRASKDGSVTFTRTTDPASGTYSSGVYTIESAVGKTGLTAVASVNAESNATTYAFRFGTSTDHKVEISLADNVYHAATFQSITTISFEISSTYTPNASFGVYYSSNGVFNDTDKMTVNVANPSVDLSEVDAKFVKFVNDSGNYAYVKNFSIGFSCSNYSNYLTSLTISGVTYDWNNNQTFVFDGTATAHYFDGSSRDVSSSVYFEVPTMTPGLKNIPIYYSENGMRVSAIAYIYVHDVVKTFTYTAINAENGYINSNFSSVVNSSSVLPSSGNIGDVIQMEAILNSGYTFGYWGAIDDDTANYIEDNLDDTDNPLNFTVQEFDSEMVIAYYASLDSLSISGQKTEFIVGTSFSLGNGVVTAHFNDGSTLSPISLDYLDVTGFNSSAVVDDQEVTISLTYNGVTKSVSYTVDIIESSGSPLVGSFANSYSFGGNPYVATLTFNSNGTGTYTVYASATGVTSGLNLTYSYSESTKTFSISFVSYFEGTDCSTETNCRTCFNNRYPFLYRQSNPDNTSGVLLDGGSVTLKTGYPTASSLVDVRTFAPSNS